MLMTRNPDGYVAWEQSVVRRRLKSNKLDRLLIKTKTLVEGGAITKTTAVIRLRRAGCFEAEITEALPD